MAMALKAIDLLCSILTQDTDLGQAVDNSATDLVHQDHLAIFAHWKDRIP